ncbi:MAG: efflux transporter outer membrane subunit [Novosphingobium sp.]|nr:efflux transporter outer membrane subunit [Novosphingobium sp.]
MKRSVPIAAIAMLALSGCVAGPDYAPPVREATGAQFLRGDGQDAAVPAAQWWKDLGDAWLDDLIERAMSDSPAVAVAEARVRKARAGIAATRASLLPSVSASALYVYADLPSGAFGTGGGQELFNLGFDAQWEADLWGGKRRDVERSVAQAGAAQAALADARVMLSAEIVRAYVTLRARQSSLELLEQRKAEEVRLADLARDRRAGGTATVQEVLAARQRIDRTSSEIATLTADRDATLDALAVLAGQEPGSLAPVPEGRIPLPPAQAKIGDPAAMLARRPDVMAAERKLAAATAGIGIAEARRFPSVSLMGIIGIGGTSIDDVFDTSQAASLVLPRLSWSFLDFGRNAAALDAAEADRDAALAEYRSSVLIALRDAEAALTRFGAARIALAHTRVASERQDEITRLQGLRAKAGTISQVEATEARIGEIDARLAYRNASANVTLAYVTLAKALGLGWQSSGD